MKHKRTLYTIFLILLFFTMFYLLVRLYKTQDTGNARTMEQDVAVPSYQMKLIGLTAQNLPVRL